ncbi:MAG TPA: MlaD family protein [Nevskiaceae bacterium]
MNDTPPPADEPPELPAGGPTATPQRTSAIFHRSWWPGWIWGIPVAAVGVVLWLSLRALSATGTDITVVFEQAAGMSAGSTAVMYRGMQVGTLKKVQLEKDGQQVIATFNIQDVAKRWLTTGTRFYLEGAHPSISNPSSLKAIIAGPTIVMVPGDGKDARHYVGVIGQAPEAFAISVRYHLDFKGALGHLDIGTPVTLEGFTVGDVVASELRVDPQTGQISTPVTVALDPTRFHIASGTHTETQWAALLDATLDRMIANGLRATITQDPPIIGEQQIDLETMPGAPPATLVAQNGGGRPGIPTVLPQGSPSQLLEKVNKLPIAAIADNIRHITARLDELVNSRQLQSSIDHLNDTLTVLDRTAQQAAPQVAPTLRSLRGTAEQLHTAVKQAAPEIAPMIRALRDTAEQIDATARSARELTGTSASTPNGNLRETLKELTRTARAVRSLADYLERHPNALITGR